jgi:hypothetical protein
MIVSHQKMAPWLTKGVFSRTRAGVRITGFRACQKLADGAAEAVANVVPAAPHVGDSAAYARAAAPAGHPFDVVDCKKTDLFFEFPCVCPEPVLVK